MEIKTGKFIFKKLTQNIFLSLLRLEDSKRSQTFGFQLFDFNFPSNYKHINISCRLEQFRKRMELLFNLWFCGELFFAPSN